MTGSCLARVVAGGIAGLAQGEGWCGNLGEGLGVPRVLVYYLKFEAFPKYALSQFQPGGPRPPTPGELEADYELVHSFTIEEEFETEREEKEFLEKVWGMFNIPPLPVPRIRSMMVGDIVVIDDRLWMAMPVGWRRL